MSHSIHPSDCLTWWLHVNKYFDVDVAHRHILTSSKHPGKIAQCAEQAKLAKYASLKHDFETVPIGVETFGPCGSRGPQLIEELGGRIYTDTCKPKSTIFLFQVKSRQGRFYNTHTSKEIRLILSSFDVVTGMAFSQEMQPVIRRSVLFMKVCYVSVPSSIWSFYEVVYCLLNVCNFLA